MNPKLKQIDDLLAYIDSIDSIDSITGEKIAKARKILKETQFFDREDTEKIVRFTIREWSTWNEKDQPDHEDLVNQWLKNECSEFMQKNYPEK